MQDENGSHGKELALSEEALGRAGKRNPCAFFALLVAPHLCFQFMVHDEGARRERFHSWALFLRVPAIITLYDCPKEAPP